MQEYVAKLIKEEMATMPKKDYLKEYPLNESTTSSPILQAELERMKAGKPMKLMDMTRYSVEPPPSSRQNDVTAWTKSLENSYSQLEHQNNRFFFFLFFFFP